MAMKIENLTDKPLWLRLNSGTSLPVAPRACSEELPGHEVDGNAQLEKLALRGTIARIAAAKEATDKPRTRRADSAA
jgi:hypothetical protein